MIWSDNFSASELTFEFFIVNHELEPEEGNVFSRQNGGSLEFFSFGDKKLNANIICLPKRFCAFCSSW